MKWKCKKIWVWFKLVPRSIWIPTSIFQLFFVELQNTETIRCEVDFGGRKKSIWGVRSSFGERKKSSYKLVLFLGSNILQMERVGFNIIDGITNGKFHWYIFKKFLIFYSKFHLQKSPLVNIFKTFIFLFKVYQQNTFRKPPTTGICHCFHR